MTEEEVGESAEDWSLAEPWGQLIRSDVNGAETDERLPILGSKFTIGRSQSALKNNP